VNRGASLSADVKDALAREAPADARARGILLDALVRYGARGGTFRTQRPAIARLVRVLSTGAPAIRKVTGARLYRTPVYELDVGAASGTLPGNREDRRIEARGAFLACGSLATPAHGYHLEFVIAEHGVAGRLAQVLTKLGLPPKRTVRKGRIVLYYKDLDRINALLTQIGAYAAVLQLEDVRAMKETKNRIRRLVNTEAANLDRAASAGAAQREAIAFVADAYGLRKLTPPVREVARRIPRRTWTPLPPARGEGDGERSPGRGDAAGPAAARGRGTGIEKAVSCVLASTASAGSDEISRKRSSSTTRRFRSRRSTISRARRSSRISSNTIRTTERTTATCAPTATFSLSEVSAYAFLPNAIQASCRGKIRARTS
jgi:hypothetical protein